MRLHFPRCQGADASTSSEPRDGGCLPPVSHIGERRGTPPVKRPSSLSSSTITFQTMSNKERPSPSRRETYCHSEPSPTAPSPPSPPSGSRPLAAPPPAAVVLISQTAITQRDIAKDPLGMGDLKETWEVNVVSNHHHSLCTVPSRSAPTEWPKFAGKFPLHELLPTNIM